MKLIKGMGPTERMTHLAAIFEKHQAIVKEQVYAFTIDAVGDWCREVRDRWELEETPHISECIRLVAKQLAHKEFNQQEAQEQTQVIRKTVQIMVEVELTGTSAQLEQALENIRPLVATLKNSIADQIWSYATNQEEDEDFYDQFTCLPTGISSYTWPHGKGVAS